MNDNYPRPIRIYYDRKLRHHVRRYAFGVSGLDGAASPLGCGIDPGLDGEPEIGRDDCVSPVPPDDGEMQES